MGNLNDFKSIVNISEKYSKFLDLSAEQIGSNKARYGFYLLVLEYITGISDIPELKSMIIDTEFSKTVFGEKNNDLGIDAVNINEDEKIIQLFNFKFREKFNEDKGQALGDMVDCVKFFLAIENQNSEITSSFTYEKIKTINEKLNSADTWEFELFMVSNDNRALDLDNSTVDNFKNSYDMEVRTITLDDLVSYISELPKDLSASFSVDNTSVMTYEVDELSSSKSYLVKLPLAELIRITCQDKKLRQSSGDYSKLQDQELEMTLLFDNVRGYLGEKTKFNKNIINTLKNEPNKFFMFNNGLTITAKNIKARYVNGKKRFECDIEGFQIVNGGQTLRTIYEFCKSYYDEEKLVNAEILIRLFQTESDIQLTNNIAEYTNSQNAISSKDLKSISNLQIKLETFLRTKDILYVRKTGDIGYNNKEYKYRISMEKVAQILYTYNGFPDRATNQKKALFEKYYDEIFYESLDFDEVVRLVNSYFEIESEYNNIRKSEGTHQKYLYIIYLMKEISMDSISDYIEYLEEHISSYKSDDDVSNARKLIQKGFKDHINESIKK